MGNQPGNQIVTARAFNRSLTSSIDISDANDIRLIETSAELGKMVVQPRVAVRLMHRDDTPVAGLPRCLEHSGNLGGVMAVVVNNRNAIHHADTCKAAIYPAKGSQSGANFIKLHTQMPRNSDSAQSIGNVVIPRHR